MVLGFQEPPTRTNLMESFVVVPTPEPSSWHKTPTISHRIYPHSTRFRPRSWFYPCPDRFYKIQPLPPLDFTSNPVWSPPRKTSSSHFYFSLSKCCWCSSAKTALYSWFWNQKELENAPASIFKSDTFYIGLRLFMLTIKHITLRQSLDSIWKQYVKHITGRLTLQLDSVILKE